jgi:hypothetical protein
MGGRVKGNGEEVLRGVWGRSKGEWLMKIVEGGFKGNWEYGGRKGFRVPVFFS